LSKKYDGSVYPTEFLQIYSTSILATGGNEVVMANYFPVALTGMNLTSWGELCHQFMANLESTYACTDNEVDLHTVQ
jgi:hypothetical protein